MRSFLSRREFVKSTIQVPAALASVMYAGNGWATPSRSALEQLNLAAIGVANKGKHNIDQLRDHQWVAFCDVDDQLLGSSAAEFPNVQKYRDYRLMLERLAPKIDGVVVSTADHTHAPATSLALQLGKHVYCEKPLTHTVAEARSIATQAAQAKVATQMGIQIHAEPNYRRVVELVQSGAIGRINQVYCWCNKAWSQGRFAPGWHRPPAHFQWDLWLGPAAYRPYYPQVHPGDWRRFWDFGAGTFGDMACHVMDLPFWALNLQFPTKVSCEGPPVHPEGTPEWCKATYEFPHADGGKPLLLHWADGNANFDLVRETKDVDQQPLANWGLGVLFVGEQGMLAADYGRRQLLPADKFSQHSPPPESIPPSPGHWNEWIQACRTGSPTTCNFDYASRLTETVLLGIVAYRSQSTVEWDAANLRVLNNPKAQQFVSKEYRRGFEVPGV